MKNMKRYSSVEAMLISEKVSPRIIAKVRDLLDRDKAIAKAFKNGASMLQLANQNSLPPTAIEDILRYELLMYSKP